jgi:hypothetical protein
MWLEVKSLTRHVRIELEDEDTDTSSAILLVPTGSTNVQVMEWAVQCPPREYLAVLRSAIEAAGVAGRRHGADLRQANAPGGSREPGRAGTTPLAPMPSRSAASTRGVSGGTERDAGSSRSSGKRAPCSAAVGHGWWRLCQCRPADRISVISRL